MYRNLFASFLIAPALLLSACSALYKATDSTAFTERQATFRWERPGRHAGLRSGPLADSLVRVDPSFPQPVRRRVAAHELMHVAGLKMHEMDPRCFLYRNAGSTLPKHLCASELRRLRRVRGTVVVRAHSTSVEDVAWAVKFLNSEVGRVLFILEASPHR